MSDRWPTKHWSHGTQPGSLVITVKRSQTPQRVAGTTAASGLTFVAAVTLVQVKSEDYQLSLRSQDERNC